MKQNFHRIGLVHLCGWFGITRQAYYHENWKQIEHSIEDELVLKEVKEIRTSHSRMGTRKVHHKLLPFMLEHQIKMGRDHLFDLLAANHMLIRRRRRNFVTTNSRHWLRKYPNLIRNFVPTSPNQLWVSDITYWGIGRFNTYISFITDAYSHKIVGYNLADNMEAIESVKALQMALKALREPLSHLIHHSDRGTQYCSYPYVKLLKENGIEISMTESGDPLENPVAERVNGIMKNEYLHAKGINSKREAMEYLTKAIQLYNAERPHLSIGKNTPDEVYYHQNVHPIKRLWKNYYSPKKTSVKREQD